MGLIFTNVKFLCGEVVVLYTMTFWLNQTVQMPLYAYLVSLLLPASYMAYVAKSVLKNRFGSSDTPDIQKDEE